MCDGTVVFVVGNVVAEGPRRRGEIAGSQNSPSAFSYSWQRIRPRSSSINRNSWISTGFSMVDDLNCCPVAASENRYPSASCVSFVISKLGPQVLVRSLHANWARFTVVSERAVFEFFRREPMLPTWAVPV